MWGRDKVVVDSMSIRILLVDSFEPWRRSVRSMLRKHAELRLVGEVGDGLAAVQQASKLKPDLILLGLDLSSLNGIETAKQICHVVPGTKILFLSIDSDADVVQAALSNGGQGFVLKTDAGNELWPAIEAVLQGKQYVSSGLVGCSHLPKVVVTAVAFQ
jgi:DNA-binding NarL/FixJ family response regulator